MSGSVLLDHQTRKSVDSEHLGGARPRFLFSLAEDIFSCGDGAEPGGSSFSRGRQGTNQQPESTCPFSGVTSTIGKCWLYFLSKEYPIKPEIWRWWDAILETDGISTAPACRKCMGHPHDYGNHASVPTCLLQTMLK